MRLLEIYAYPILILEKKFLNKIIPKFFLFNKLKEDTFQMKLKTQVS